MSRRAIVAGGAGGVGRGIVQALRADGVRVTILSRAAAHLEPIVERFGIAGDDGVDGLEIDLSRPTEAAIEALRAIGPLDVAVISVGNGWLADGPLLTLPEARFALAVDDGLHAHLRAAQLAIPQLRPEGTYVMVNGTAALAPAPDAGAMSIGSIAQAMMTRALDLEVRVTGGPRIFGLLLGPVVTETRKYRDPAWVSAEEVGALVNALSRHRGTPFGPLLEIPDRAAARDLLAKLGAPGG